MATTTPPAPPRTQVPNQVKIYSHSSLFYWWPVWAMGFILGLLTLTENAYMVVVPSNAEAKRSWKVLVKSETREGKTIVLETQDREGVLLKQADDPKKQKHLAPNEDEADLAKDPALK